MADIQKMSRRQVMQKMWFGALVFSMARPTLASVFFNSMKVRRSAPSDLKISDLRIAVIKGAPMTCPIVRIDTNQGISGYGEIRDAADPKLALDLKTKIIDLNPCDVESIFSVIRPYAGHGRAGGGVSGIEMALWDLAGKAHGVPVYELLGGKCRDTFRLYADTPEPQGNDRYHPDGRPNGIIVGERLKARMAAGYTFLKFDFGINLLNRAPGSTIPSAPQGASATEHPPSVELTELGIQILAGYVAEVRSVVGMDVPLASDHFGPITVASCIRLATALEKFKLAWLEDMVPWEYTAWQKQISDAVTTPILTGEDIFGLDGFHDLLAGHAVDLIQPDIATAGGILETKRIGDAAAAQGIPMALHYAGSPIGFAASLHCAAVTQNFVVLENHSVDVPWWNDLVTATGTRQPLINSGFGILPDGPGLGVEPNEEVFRAHLGNGGYFEPSVN
jgi:L-alanine-DL-glutamate epimerase-like enolase superfamily enzyme